MLPLGPVGHGHSPYSGHSAFAGNPLLVSPDRLREDGLLDEADLAARPAFSVDRVEFARVVPWKEKLLRTAWARFLGGSAAELRPSFDAFRSSPDQTAWLDDWSLFAALKARFGGTSWTTWPDALRRREKDSLRTARRELGAEVDYQAFVQFLFFRQWKALHDAARARHVAIFGDLPIYVALDSADVWAHPELFDLDGELQPHAIAGVPPDYFSETGQLWGNPLYRWERMAEDDFAWWIERLRANLRIADVVRIDHFRAFASYWAVPAGEKTAIHGRWIKAPGRALFRAVRRALGDVAIAAEDLGHITPDVERLLDFAGFPRMKVLQFAFSKPDDPFLPHNYSANCVVYTGTHDNDTTRSWWAALNETDKGRVLDYLGGDPNGIEWSLIRASYASVAERAIVPMQDALGLGSEARMNTPAESDGNWDWRVRREQLRPELAARLRRLAELFGRCS